MGLPNKNALKYEISQISALFHSPSFEDTILLFLFFIVLLVVGIIYLMLSPMFNIKSIEVINNCYINSNEIICIYNT